MENVPCPSIRWFFCWFLCISINQKIFHEPTVICKKFWVSIDLDLRQWSLFSARFLLFGSFTNLQFSGKGILYTPPIFLDFWSINPKNFGSSNEIFPCCWILQSPSQVLIQKNFVLYMFSNICLAFKSLTLLSKPKWWDAIFRVATTCKRIRLPEIELSFPTFVNTPTTHDLNGVLKVQHHY